MRPKVNGRPVYQPNAHEKEKPNDSIPEATCSVNSDLESGGR